MTLPVSVVRLRAGEGEQVSPRAGARATFKARTEQTGGAYSLVEWEHEPGAPGPPLHVHDREEEAFYVLSGAVAVSVGGVRTEEGTGAFVLVPRGTPHTFSVVGDEPARMLLILSPPGYEGFWEELSAATDGGMRQPGADIMSGLGARYHMRVLPPEA
jgi:quercetin dioxygenase-like cupin family protein